MYVKDTTDLRAAIEPRKVSLRTLWNVAAAFPRASPRDSAVEAVAAARAAAFASCHSGCAYALLDRPPPAPFGRRSDRMEWR